MDNAEQILETNSRLNNRSAVEYSLGALLMTRARSLGGGSGFDRDAECIGQ
jgi:hypothetical protein